MTRRIKILQITHNLGIGGLERVVVNLCRHLDRRKFDVSVACLGFKGAFADELEKEGIRVYLASKDGKTDYLTFWQLQKIIGRVQPDIVHTHNTNSSIDGVLASLIRRVPIRVHTDHARNFPDRKLYMALEWCASLFMDKIIAVSEETRDNLVKYEKIKRDKITVLNNGIDGSDYDITIDTEAKKKEIGVDGFEHIIGLGVRLTAQKGIIHLINSAPAIVEKLPKTAFLIAGYGALESYLKSEVSRLKLDKNFFFLGPRLDMPELLQIFDLYALPSEWEGLPLVILEAMAAKRAIVATDVGGNSMAIQHRSSGSLVPPKDPDALADEIIYLLKHPEIRAVYSKKAYQRFYSKFSVSHMARNHEILYGQLLSGNVN